jgi:hypothetical protein
MSSLPPFLRLGRALVLLAALVLPASTGRTAEPAPLSRRWTAGGAS